MIVHKRYLEYNFNCDFIVKLLCPQKSFTQRNYIWIPIGDMKNDLLWLCIKPKEENGRLKYRSIIAFKLSNKKDISCIRVKLSSSEMLEIIYTHDNISGFIKEILEK